MTLAGGTIPAPVTPFTRGGAEVDLDLLDAHLAWLDEQGIASPTSSRARSRRCGERSQVSAPPERICDEL